MIDGQLLQAGQGPSMRRLPVPGVPHDLDILLLGQCHRHLREWREPRIGDLWPRYGRVRLRVYRIGTKNPPKSQKTPEITGPYVKETYYSGGKFSLIGASQTTVNLTAALSRLPPIDGDRFGYVSIDKPIRYDDF